MIVAVVDRTVDNTTILGTELENVIFGKYSNEMEEISIATPAIEYKEENQLDRLLQCLCKIK